MPEKSICKENNGCRLIAFITGPGHFNISKERLDGYRKGLTECGLKIAPDLTEGCNL